MTATKTTFLCISSFFKGEEFLRACKAAGNIVFLITSKKLETEPWPREAIDEIFYMQEFGNNQWNINDLISGIAYVMQSNKIDRIVALDDFEVEKATLIREHFRIPGMGQSTGRYFRDKLAMRIKASEAAIPVPAFTAIFNNSDIERYTNKIAPPWLLKPRAEASATGIKKVYSSEELWTAIESLGQQRHEFLLEQFRPGDVYHVDALSVDGQVVFTQVSQYLSTPMDVAHGHGIFRSRTLNMNSPEAEQLQKLNKQVLQAFGMQFSASHTEYIKSKETGDFYFLETSSRVGGAHLAEMVEAATGINLWREWAVIENAAAKNIPYVLPDVQMNAAGIVVSLCRYQHPDMTAFKDSEIWWRLQMDYHIGFILKSENHDRITDLLEQYTHIIGKDFHAEGVT